MNMLVDTVLRIQKDMAILHEVVLRTPAASQVIQVPRRAALRDEENAGVRRNY